MKFLKITVPMFLCTSFIIGEASAQTAPVRHHPDYSLPGVSPFVGSRGGGMLPGGGDLQSRIGPSFKLSQSGDEAAKNEDWQTARSKYQDALNLWPENPLAIYGLAKCAELDGDTTAAIGYYRKAIYYQGPKVASTIPNDGFQTNDVSRLMEYALLLSQTHQEIEAQKVYKRAAHLLNYQDSQFNNGKPFLKVLLPEFGTAPHQIAYTPQRLQAMAHVTLSLYSSWFDGKIAMPEIQKALQLYPNSAVVYYYQGELLLAKDHDGAKAAYQKAAQLGDDQTQAAVNMRLKKMF